jgi:hypothetical protein
MSKTKQAKKYLLPALLIAILAVSVFSLQVFMASSNQPKVSGIPYVGIAFCGNTTAEAKQLIDRTKTYTNLFILDTAKGNPISANQSQVEEISDYAVSQGLSVIVNLGFKDVWEDGNLSWFWQPQSLDSIKANWTQRWGDKFLGVYYNDEPGGIQLDGSWIEFFQRYSGWLSRSNQTALVDLNTIYNRMLDTVYNGTAVPESYDLEANFYVQDVIAQDPGFMQLKAAGIRTFTSDYALYWFDYLGSYDVLFAEAGANCSLTQQIDLVKGAARLQDKPWGLMVTWKYYDMPYLSSGNEMYDQMMLGFQAGAKYITVFNYPTNVTAYGALTDEHFSAIQRFWNDIHQKSFEDKSLPNAALVLPHNYGWGMRFPNDTIWGFWKTDGKTQQIAVTMSSLLAQYGTSLDIIYEDSTYPASLGNYKAVYYWNSTTV